MLNKFIEQGIDFEKNKEIKEVQDFGSWRIAHATYGFFSTPESRKTAVPEIHEQTKKQIEQVSTLATARIKASSLWANNQLNLIKELHQTIPEYENQDSLMQWN